MHYSLTACQWIDYKSKETERITNKHYVARVNRSACRLTCLKGTTINCYGVEIRFIYQIF